MNVEIGAEAVLFPEKEYIKGMAVAVQTHECGNCGIMSTQFLLWEYLFQHIFGYWFFCSV